VAAALASGGSQHAAIQAAAAEVLKTLQAGLQRLQMSRKQADKNLERTTNNLQVRCLVALPAGAWQPCTAGRWSEAACNDCPPPAACLLCVAPQHLAFYQHRALH
jgi:hypothetical protein